MERYLGDLDRCFVCPSEQSLPLLNGHSLTNDHIFPVKSGKDHHWVLGAVVEGRFNLTRICRADHDTVDRQKMKIYREEGILGVIKFVALSYPRAENHDLYSMQFTQWNTLFTRLRDSFFRLNGQTPPHLQSEYSRGLDLTNEFLLRWERGNF